MPDEQHAKAVQLMDRAFGSGVAEAHRLLEENAGAKRIYDCALVAISEEPLVHVNDRQRELAARALCRKAGHPENTKFEGKPMWMSFLGDVETVLQSLTKSTRS